MKLLKAKKQSNENDAVLRGLKIAAATDVFEKRLNALKDAERSFREKWESSFVDFSKRMAIDLASVEQTLSALESRKKDFERPLEIAIKEAKEPLMELNMAKVFIKDSISEIKNEERRLSEKLANAKAGFEEAKIGYNEVSKFIGADKEFYETKTKILEEQISKIDKKILDANEIATKAFESLIKIEARLSAKEDAISITQNQLEIENRRLEQAKEKLASQAHALKLDYDYLRKKGML